MGFMVKDVHVCMHMQVQQLKATVELMQLPTPQQEQPDPTISTLSSLLTSLSGLQHKQQHWQQQQQQRPSMLVPPARVPLQPHNQQQQQWSSALPPSSPLDKVTAALQAALDAATSRSSVASQAAMAEGSNMGGSAVSAGASSSRRSSLSPWPPNGAGQGVVPELAAEGSWVSDAPTPWVAVVHPAQFCTASLEQTTLMHFFRR